MDKTNSDYEKFIKYKNKYLNLKQKVNTTDKKPMRILNLRQVNNSTVKSNGIQKVKLLEAFMKSSIYNLKYYPLVFDVITQNKDDTYNLQGMVPSKNHLNEPTVVNLKNIPISHVETIEDGSPRSKIDNRNKPPLDKSKCIIVYFPEENRAKFDKLNSTLFPLSLNNLEKNLQTILFNVLSLDGEYCEIKYKDFYFGSYPTKYLLFGSEHKKN